MYPTPLDVGAAAAPAAVQGGEDDDAVAGVEHLVDVHRHALERVGNRFGRSPEGIEAVPSASLDRIGWVDPLDLGVEQSGGDRRALLLPRAVDVAHRFHVVE